MGGHLTCVSCSQVKEKDNEPYKSTATNHHKPATGPDKSTGAATTSPNQIHLNINNDTNELHDQTTNSSAICSRISALEIYNVIKENTRNNNSSTTKLNEVGEDEDVEEDEDDVEKAAKAIVDMSLFITTKVIYPAYVRYLEMDHPDLYEEYFGNHQGGSGSECTADD